MSTAGKRVYFPLLSSALCSIIALPPDELPSWGSLIRLAVSWNRAHGRRNIKYLRHICRLAQDTRGPILECGSGLATLLLGLVGEKYGKQVYTLEHSEPTAEFMDLWLKRFHITNVNIVHAPLISYSEFSWYNVDRRELPENFSLVICEGPSPSDKNRPYGLLPVMSENLAADCRVILHDSLRLKEPHLLNQWSKIRPVAPAPIGGWFQPFREIALL